MNHGIGLLRLDMLGLQDSVPISTGRTLPIASIGSQISLTMRSQISRPFYMKTTQM